MGAILATVLLGTSTPALAAPITLMCHETYLSKRVAEKPSTWTKVQVIRLDLVRRTFCHDGCPAGPEPLASMAPREVVLVYVPCQYGETIERRSGLMRGFNNVVDVSVISGTCSPAPF